MTKRRPSWSERLQWAATLVCGLLLLNVSTAWATHGRLSAKKHEASSVHRASSRSSSLTKAGKKPARHGARGARVLGRNNTKNHRRTSLEPEVLTAEIKDEDVTGLHGLNGLASYYAYGFQGRRTATGEVFRVKEFTAASNHFPLGTLVAVRRMDNNQCAVVKINDRMHRKHRKRIIDVSRGVAEYLDMIRSGVVLVSVVPLKDGRQEPGAPACHTAFEAEAPCLDCAPVAPQLPVIGGETSN